MSLIPIGNTTVSLDMYRWEKHDRERFEIRILCSDNPFSDYDGIRDISPSFSEVKEAVDWIIENEEQDNMKGYSKEQIIDLKAEIDALLND